MLVLSRSKDQKIVINKDITVTVLQIRPHQVRLGIEAPDGMSVDRLEIHLQKLEKGEEK